MRLEGTKMGPLGVKAGGEPKSTKVCQESLLLTFTSVLVDGENAMRGAGREVRTQKL